MKIAPNTTLTDIQNAFSNKFAHLRIEFYKRQHEAGTGSADREKLNHDRTMHEISGLGADYVLTFDGNMKIKDFEALLDKDLGLHAQVFRRSANLWLQTTTTDEWTLDKAEQKGGHSQEILKQTSEEEPELPGQETE